MSQKNILNKPEEIIESLLIANNGYYKGFSSSLYYAQKHRIRLQVDGYGGKDIIKRILSERRYAQIFKAKTYHPNIDAFYQGSVHHGIDHNLRVSILSAFIGIESELSEEDFKIIIDGALYHDIGRIDDNEDSNHGLRAIEKLDSLNLGYDKNEIKILKFIIESHCVDDKKVQEVLKKYNFSDLEKKRALTLEKILKDADALDLTRMRAVDPDKLRTETAKKLLGAACELVANINSFNIQDTDWLSLDELISKSSDIYKNNYNEYRNNKQLVKEFDNSMLQRGRQRFCRFIRIFENELSKKAVSKLETKEEVSGIFDKKIEICGRQYTAEELKNLFADEDSRENIDEYIRSIQSEPPKITIFVDKTERVVIEEDTLIQGLKRYDEHALEGISKYGLICHKLLSKESQKTSLTEDCTDVFKVEKTMPIQSYFEDYSTLEYVNSQQGSKQNRQSNERDGRRLTIESGLNFQMKDEASFLPSWMSPGIAFIIDPRNAMLLKKQHIPEHKRGYKVPFAISPTCLAGLMIPPENEDKLEYLKKLFSNQYIVSTDGRLLYMPKRAEKKEMVDINQTQDKKNPLYWVKKNKINGMMMRFGISDIESVDTEIMAKIKKLKEKDEQEERIN